ncbi:bisdemethoxycurcumin synthase-like [Oryza glaberrima]|uniref:bisdemethoxycurcumin synthase-like n=1 Tax=Oryza glaberrima TaxID=4538 RepID=UPI00224C24C8|nr:bisdemethoxycurcumin synthase-like [Oryza glaberrima]
MAPAHHQAAAATTVTTQDIRRAQRADGPATVLAIATANPETRRSQDEYADFYFRVTKSEHLPQLKEKLERICKKSGIENRYTYVNDEVMKAHPEFSDRKLPSLDARVEIASNAVPELAAAAASMAIAEWGRPATDITHLIFSTYSDLKAPSSDRRLASLLGLRHTVCRTILSLHGCYGGCRALQLAKELAENNRGARGCTDTDTLVAHALFGDGSGAVIVGADPVDAVERPLFEMAFASQTTVPDSEGAITVQHKKGGMEYHIARGLPEMLAGNIKRCLADAFGAIGVAARWKDLFWAVHPGGRRILDLIEEALGLDNGAMAASRQVLREYGNMSGSTVIFVLNELRRRFAADGAEGADWGALMAFGPGITAETILLRVASGLKGN